jgi:hypothetical protein
MSRCKRALFAAKNRVLWPTCPTYWPRWDMRERPTPQHFVLPVQRVLPWASRVTRARESRRAPWTRLARMRVKSHSCAWCVEFPATCRKGGTGRTGRTDTSGTACFYCPTSSFKVGQVGQTLKRRVFSSFREELVKTDTCVGFGNWRCVRRERQKRNVFRISKPTHVSDLKISDACVVNGKSEACFGFGAAGRQATTTNQVGRRSFSNRAHVHDLKSAMRADANNAKSETCFRFARCGFFPTSTPGERQNGHMRPVWRSGAVAICHQVCPRSECSQKRPMGRIRVRRTAGPFEALGIIAGEEQMRTMVRIWHRGKCGLITRAASRSFRAGLVKPCPWARFETGDDQTLGPISGAHDGTRSAPCCTNAGRCRTTPPRRPGPPFHGSFPAPPKRGQRSRLGCPARSVFQSRNLATARCATWQLRDKQLTRCSAGGDTGL